jgi:pimeloyl-ACP methyl ester carboxylesterase
MERELAPTARELDVDYVGAGPPVVLVHGSIVDARRTWHRQLELADEWELCIPNRPGFAASPPLTRGDFEVEAPLMAELLGDGAHLVGHSYGAVIALLAAAARPEAVRSLTVSEPGSLRLAAGNPAVDTVIAQGEELYRRRGEVTPREFVQLFRAGVHSARETPDPLPEWLERGARLVMEERPPWEADVPIEALAAAPFPKLVISGDHSPAFEAVCDVLAERVGAQRAVIGGRGHTIPSTGAPYNERLLAFLTECEERHSPRGARPRP